MQPGTRHVQLQGHRHQDRVWGWQAYNEQTDGGAERSQTNGNPLIPFEETDRPSRRPFNHPQQYLQDATRRQHGRSGQAFAQTASNAPSMFSGLPRSPHQNPFRSPFLGVSRDDSVGAVMAEEAFQKPFLPTHLHLQPPAASQNSRWELEEQPRTSTPANRRPPGGPQAYGFPREPSFQEWLSNHSLRMQQPLQMMPGGLRSQQVPFQRLRNRAPIPQRTSSINALRQARTRVSEDEGEDTIEQHAGSYSRRRALSRGHRIAVHHAAATRFEPIDRTSEDDIEMPDAPSMEGLGPMRRDAPPFNGWTGPGSRR